MPTARIVKNKHGLYDILLGSKQIATYRNYQRALECCNGLNFDLKINRYIKNNIVTLGLSLRKRFGLSRRESLQYTLEVIQEMV